MLLCSKVHGMNEIHPEMMKALGHWWSVLLDTPLQCHVDDKDSTCGVADLGFGSPLQKVGPEDCAQPIRKK